MLRLKVIILASVMSFTITVSSISQTIIHSFPSPGSEPRGLTWDGTFLWCAEYSTGKIYKLNSETGVKIDSFSFPIQTLFGGITWGSEGQIWIANGGVIFEIDPDSGDTLSNFSCPGG